MQAALTAVIALLSLSLVSCFLDKEIFEYCIQEKELKRIPVIYITTSVLLLAWALIVLPGAAQAESFSDAGDWTQVGYILCAIMSVCTFLLQALIRAAISQNSRNQKTRTKSIKSLRLQRPRTARRSRPKS